MERLLSPLEKSTINGILLLVIHDLYMCIFTHTNIHIHVHITYMHMHILLCIPCRYIFMLCKLYTVGLVVGLGDEKAVQEISEMPSVKQEVHSSLQPEHPATMLVM